MNRTETTDWIVVRPEYDELSYGADRGKIEGLAKRGWKLELVQRHAGEAGWLLRRWWNCWPTEIHAYHGGCASGWYVLKGLNYLENAFVRNMRT